MRPTRPLPLHHSWPLFERGQRFELGWLHGDDDALPALTALRATDGLLLAERGIGLWECDLIDNQLSWSPGVFDLFGLPHDCMLLRTDVVTLYCEESRAAMERLRAYAIRHRRGFTLDVEICPSGGDRRWIRLMTAPVCAEGRVVRLHGVKQDVTPEYL